MATTTASSPSSSSSPFSFALLSPSARVAASSGVLLLLALYVTGATLVLRGPGGPAALTKEARACLSLGLAAGFLLVTTMVLGRLAPLPQPGEGVVLVAGLAGRLGAVLGAAVGLTPRSGTTGSRTVLGVGLGSAEGRSGIGVGDMSVGDADGVRSA